MSAQQAVISNVVRRVAASALSSDLSGGEVEVPVEDPNEFPEPGDVAGQIIIAPGDEDSETLSYTAVDDVAGTLVLDPATPVVNGWDRGTDVQIWPATMEHEVMCYLDGQIDGDPLVAVLPHALEPLVPEGTRDPGAGESILVEQRDLIWVVVDVLGEAPVISQGLLLWGGSTGDLLAAGFDFTGEQIAELSSGIPGFASLYVGDFFSPTVPSYGEEDLEFWVDPDDGDDANDGSVLFPLASIGAAIGRVPKLNGGDVVITVVLGAQLSEALDIESYSGAGSITIDGQSQTTVLSGTVAVDGVSMDVVLKNITVDDDTADGDVLSQEGLLESTIFCRNSRLLTIDNCNIQSHGAKDENLFAQAANVLVQNNTEFHGATARILRAGATATVTMTNTKGSSTAGSAVLANGSTVRLGGSRPAGTLDTANGGRVTDDSTGTNAGGASGGGTKHTKYYSATQTGSWRDAFGGEWRSDTDDVYQGSYGYGNHRGCWFYPISTLQSDLAGKHIDAAYLLVRRKAQGGVSGPVPLQLWTHDRSSKSGQPSLNAPDVIGSLAWGGQRWLKIPASFVERLRDGTGGAKGLALYRADGSAYAICSGKGGFGSTGRLKVSYH